ncbi:MAG: response regulator [Planctomycetes bacterium]|nr:response regulator [Planctomycetota bacterium]
MTDTVLLIEDDDDFAESVMTILKHEGMKVVHTKSGQEALDILKNNTTIRVVILDLKLPGSDYDGKKLAHEIKLKFTNVKVIVLTGHPEQLPVGAAEKLGVYYYLEKPLGKEQLKFAIKGALSKASPHKMYISKIEIQNIQCFEKLKIDLEQNGKPGKPILWTTLLGDNAIGKTTLLRSIALGLCNQGSSAALIKKLGRDFLRWDTSYVNGEGYKGSINITLKKEADDYNYSITTEIIKKKRHFPEEIYQKTKPEEYFPWDDILVCGYGTNRAAPADAGFENYDTLKTVSTLFDNTSSFQNPELVIRRQEPEIQVLIIKKLLKILMLDKNVPIELTERGMKIPGPWGIAPVEALSDGYKSTIHWVLDFFGWQIYAKNVSSDKDLTGILLIDELEQHLHPKWQRYIVGRLKKQFPKVQFITTTHSPLLASGASDVEDSKLLYLKFKKAKDIECIEMEPDALKGMRADQVLTSESFELPTSRSGDTSEKFVRFRELFLQNSLTEKEKEEFEILKETLKHDIPESGEREEERKTQRELRQLLLDVKSELKIQNSKDD